MCLSRKRSFEWNFFYSILKRTNVDIFRHLQIVFSVHISSSNSSTTDQCKPSRCNLSCLEKEVALFGDDKYSDAMMPFSDATFKNVK